VNLSDAGSDVGEQSSSLQILGVESNDGGQTGSVGRDKRSDCSSRCKGGREVHGE
jgi:hypothetical protein